jgi:hypothetical protein
MQDFKFLLRLFTLPKVYEALQLPGLSDGPEVPESLKNRDVGAAPIEQVRA